ncbi:hypothetical protein L842_1376 [Mycobacterium intracellulare MIN_052511_1280]|nr:hypothetical protein L842_1376 [Mycobacterium intracellulare MIN_052511_1280]
MPAASFTAAAWADWPCAFVVRGGSVNGVKAAAADDEAA